MQHSALGCGERLTFVRSCSHPEGVTGPGSIAAIEPETAPRPAPDLA